MDPQALLAQRSALSPAVPLVELQLVQLVGVALQRLQRGQAPAVCAAGRHQGWVASAHMHALLDEGGAGLAHSATPTE